MPDNKEKIDIFFYGIGGQGTVLASEITGNVLFESKHDIKLTISRGIAKRFGAVTCQLRAGNKVYSPIPLDNKFDIILQLSTIEPNTLATISKKNTILISPDFSPKEKILRSTDIPNNMIMLGILSKHFKITDNVWVSAIKKLTRKDSHPVNIKAFNIGRGTDE